MVFIAITPDSSLKNETILIGANCVTGKNTHQVIDKKLHIINPYKSHEDILKASEYCWNVALGYCQHLGKLLNKIHDVSYSPSYWKTLLLPWATYVIGIVYDRYLRLCYVRNNYPNPVIEIPQINLSDPLYKHGFDAYNLISYNISLYSLLIEIMGLSANVIYLDIDSNSANSVNEVRKTNILTFLRISIKDLTKTLHIYKNLIKALCIYQNMDFSQSVSLSPKDGDFLKQALNRGELIFESTNDEFKNILHNITKWILPISYFEEYRERNNIANELLMKKKIEAVHIYNSFWTNDTFKFMISQVRENGGVIIGRQHGGGYGHHIVSPSERVEREISDFFITWGWTDKRLSPAIPLPDPRLSKFLNVHQEKNKNILFIGSHGQMYMFDYQSYFMPEFVHQQYYLLKKRFFKKLKEPIQKSILYRPYLYEYGWEERSRIKEILPDVCFDESTEAVENMKTCSLVVIDHPSTSFLEALVINVPTILFWDNEQAPMREEAKLYFQLLTDVGILHYNPESAAQKVNKIWDDIHGWWQQPEVQKAKDEFCWQFARTSKNRHKAWRVFLRTLK